MTTSFTFVMETLEGGFTEKQDMLKLQKKLNSKNLNIFIFFILLIKMIKVSGRKPKWFPARYFN